jgi:hypothetical protein
MRRNNPISEGYMFPVPGKGQDSLQARKRKGQLRAVRQEWHCRRGDICSGIC